MKWIAVFSFSTCRRCHMVAETPDMIFKVWLVLDGQRQAQRYLTEAKLDYNKKIATAYKSLNVTSEKSSFGQCPCCAECHHGTDM